MTKPSHWYALYTCSRCEKKVACELQHTGILYYLPLIKTMRQWSDRRKMVEVPLIYSYVFVKITDKEQFVVQQTPGVVRIVSFDFKPVRIPDWQIENLRIITGNMVPFTHETSSFTKGMEVVIVQGTLRGLRGSLLRIKSKSKLLISISAINYNLTIDIDPYLVEPVK